MFASGTELDTLTLTVEAGDGYEPGDPPTADASFNIAIPSCVGPPRVPPPVVTGPNFTG